MEVKSCGFISHSPTRFKFGWDEEDELCFSLKASLEVQIAKLYTNGCEDFYTLCDSGAGLWFGEIVLSMKRLCPDLKLHCILAHEEIANKWAPYLRERHFDMLASCDEEIIFGYPNTKNVKRDVYLELFQHSDTVIALYDPYSMHGDVVDHGMLYLRNTRKKYLLMHPDTLALTMVEPTE